VKIGARTVGSLLLAACPAWFGCSRGPAPPTSVLYGNVDIREVNLGFRVPGKIAEVLRDEGDSIKKGDRLARLDDEPFQRELDQARAQVAVAAARLQLLRAGNRPEEIAQAAAVTHEREVTATNAERVFKRQQELFETRAVSVQERDDAEARFHEAQARANSAREQLLLLKAGFRVEDVEQARAELDRSQASVKAAELRVADTVLMAPEEGVILTRAQEPGAVIQAGATIFSVSLARPVWVRAFVSEPDLARVPPGLRVEITTDSHGAKTYHGTVGYVSPRAEFTPKSVETPELRTSLVYRLRIVVEDADAGLRQGMPVTVRLPGGSR
jgi:HlyD family secretion protein